MQVRFTPGTEDGPHFLYFDYELDRRRLRYIGVGVRQRLRDKVRNTHHTNMAMKHGVLRVVVNAFQTQREAFAAEAFEVQAAWDRGEKLVNIERGGRGGPDARVLYRHLEYPVYCSHPKGSVPAGAWVPIRTNFRTVVDGQGNTHSQPTSQPMGDFVGYTKGTVFLVRDDGSESRQFPAGSRLPGWHHPAVNKVILKDAQGNIVVQDKRAPRGGLVHILKGRRHVVHRETGERRTVPSGPPPPGFEAVNSGYVLERHLVTHTFRQRYHDDPQDSAWVPARTGMVTILLHDGSAASWSADQSLPVGAIYCMTGRETLRNVLTGKTAAFQLGADRAYPWVPINQSTVPLFHKVNQTWIEHPVAKPIIGSWSYPQDLGKPSRELQALIDRAKTWTDKCRAIRAAGYTRHHAATWLSRPMTAIRQDWRGAAQRVPPSMRSHRLRGVSP